VARPPWQSRNYQSFGEDVVEAVSSAGGRAADMARKPGRQELRAIYETGRPKIKDTATKTT